MDDGCLTSAQVTYFPKRHSHSDIPRRQVLVCNKQITSKSNPLSNSRLFVIFKACFNYRESRRMPASLTVNFIPRWLYNKTCHEKTCLQNLDTN